METGSTVFIPLISSDRSLSLVISSSYHLFQRAAVRSSSHLKPNVGINLSSGHSTSPKCSDKRTKVISFTRRTRHVLILLPEFVDMLNEMRFGRLSFTSIARFRSLSRDIQYGDDIGPTEL